jgi:predicted molibdopterin-dependent oxidoreductase YjgC
VHRIEHGEGRPEDLDLLNRVTDNMMGKTICALADAAAFPVRSFIKHFRASSSTTSRTRSAWSIRKCSGCRQRLLQGRGGVMVEIEIDGKTLQVADGSTVIEAAHQAGHLHPALLLPQEAVHRGQLPHVPGPGGKGAEADAGLRHAGDQRHEGAFTHSDLAVKAQKAVMEFLLINHPLDCPICDQGGECQLQDLAVGYGESASKYEEEKRVVPDKDLGPLVSTDMTRCINCTRCVRFTAEIAGFMELGQSYRGERAEVMPFIGKTGRIPNCPATSSTCARSAR